MALVFPNEFQGLNLPKEVYPNTGGIILFPSFMGHYVQRNNHDSPRIVVSGNYRQKDLKKSFQELTMYIKIFSKG